MLAVHADWSLDARKRWQTRAKRTDTAWQIAAPEPVGDLATWMDRLGAAARGPVALGVDLPLGLPRGYIQTHAIAGDFPTFVKSLRHHPTFFAVNETLDTIAPARPFYPARGLKGMTRAAHAAALGLDGPSGLSRLCDRATAIRPAGAPLFWTLGANQTGKAAISAWRDWLIPALHRGLDLAIWPFARDDAGDFTALLARHQIVVAETYPAEAMRHLGLRMAGSKRRQSDRIALAPALNAALARLAAEPAPALQAALADGFGADPAGEDRFDSLIGVLGVLNVLAGHRPGTAPPDPWLTTWEGWVLGQTHLPHRLS